MLFTRNKHKPIYNSLHDLKSDKTINEWFNYHDKLNYLVYAIYYRRQG